MSVEEQLLRSLAKRRAIRASLTEWSRFNGFEPAPHHQLLIEHLEAVEAGDIERLAVFMPPGSAKSTYCSVLFPPWFMARNPGKHVLAASHTIPLAQKWGRRVRNIVNAASPMLGCTMSEDNQAAGRWSLSTGGEYYAAGVGVGIAGFRSDLGVIDDPIRSREDAESETIREKIWDWYLSDYRARRRPGGRTILVQTRWHEDDLAGRAMAEMAAGKDQWVVLSLPAEAELNDPLGRKPGELLWSDDPNYDYGSFLRAEKLNQLPRNWASLFQQRPAPEDGDYFLREWISEYSTKHVRTRDGNHFIISFVDKDGSEVRVDSRTLNIYGASDYAVTNDGGDYTVHIVVGVDPQKRMFVLDMWREQASSNVWIDAFCDLVIKWKPIEWAEEKGQINASLGPYILERTNERDAYTYRRGFPSRFDKATRAQSIRGRMAQRGLYVPGNAPWRATMIAELMACWNGKHDDIGDALGLIGQLLDEITEGDELKNEGRKKPGDYKPLINQNARQRMDAWRTRL